MGKKEAKDSHREDVHTLRELCENLFEIKLRVAMYGQKPLTQKDVDGLYQMVRLVNEQKIWELGLKPKVTEKFRLLAQQNHSLEKTMPKGIYDRAIAGRISAAFFRPNDKKVVLKS